MNKVKIINNKYLYPFDAIYVILLSDSESRKKNVELFLKDFNSYNDVKIVETTKKPWLKYFISDKLKLKCYYEGEETYAAFDCLLNHYNCIKSSYLNGLEKIMIIEDDANFVCDIKDYIDIINNIPEDADILQFIPEEKIIKKFREDKFWLDYKTYDIKLKFKTNPENRWSTIMYILNREGMKYFIDYYDNNIIIADQPFFDYKSDLNYYVCNRPVLSVKYKSNIMDIMKRII